MSKKKVDVNAKGIKNRLKRIKPFRAIAEYIWNGFDAGANTVNINYTTNELNAVDSLSISDNGNGIPFDQVDAKFKPVLSSEKQESETQHTLIHGKNGLGRLTFHHFSEKSEWKTTFKNDDKFLTYSIFVDAANIDNYDQSELTNSFLTETGTEVSFTNIYGIDDDYFKNEVTTYLKKEFASFLEINKSLGFDVNINGKSLDYSSLIKEREEFELNIEGKNFNISFVRWINNLNNHSSRYYCIDSKGFFKYSKTTSFNKKGDSFYHSFYIVSEYFDEFEPYNKDETNPQQGDMFVGISERSDVFKQLILEVNKIIKDKRDPFIVSFAKQLVDDYESLGVFPEYNKNSRWEAIRMEDIKETVAQLYHVEPKIFKNLNIQQKKTLVGFISLIVDSGNIDDLFSILDGIIELDSSQRECFARQLKTTKMSSIVNTIELISDRFKAVEDFEKLVFDPSMYAGEVPHLQTMMEKNYWLIGEQYQLLTAAEPKFEEALRRYNYILRGESETYSIAHKSKNREMDLFLIRQGFNSQVDNVVVELKHPENVRLGKKELDQVYDYYQVIRSESMFNASNSTWKFYLIGNKFDSTDYIQGQINNFKHHGEPGLAFSGDYKIYVFTWSEVFNDFRLRHKFLQKRLELQLNNLNVGEHESADEIVNKIRTSDSPAELVVD
ncbi:ATP-binding protein [Vibrio cholerae]|uniref:ATP-binding protein n=1 Tax=Vibrio cholerae TaxID=666 RepID=UPI002094EF8F|nr:ATP-binding protein [Vibrio cholerae]MCO7072171.1 ATP-binding protein [Vibrio cholerae]